MNPQACFDILLQRNQTDAKESCSACSQAAILSTSQSETHIPQSYENLSIVELIDIFLKLQEERVQV
jgi:hypothetical protein